MKEVTYEDWETMKADFSYCELDHTDLHGARFLSIRSKYV